MNAFRWRGKKISRIALLSCLPRVEFEAPLIYTYDRLYTPRAPYYDCGSTSPVLCRPTGINCPIDVFLLFLSLSQAAPGEATLASVRPGQRRRRDAVQIGFDTDDEEQDFEALQGTAAESTAPEPHVAPRAFTRRGDISPIMGVLQRHVPIEEENVQHAGGWGCMICTFRNANSLGLACAVCGGERSS